MKTTKPGPKSAALLAACARARPAPGGCAWCGTPLPPGRRTWCRNRCASIFWENHWWTLARRTARRRDKYRCVRCGRQPPRRPGRRIRGLEVNHRVPCLGAHGILSCSHHLDNLETLCAPCHRAHTAALPRRVQAGPANMLK